MFKSSFYSQIHFLTGKRQRQPKTDAMTMSIELCSYDLCVVCETFLGQLNDTSFLEVC